MIHYAMMSLFAAAVWLISLSFARGEETSDGKVAVRSNLRAGAAKVDITPDNAAGMLVTGHPRHVSGV